MPLYPADSVRPVRPGHFMWIDVDPSLPILTLTNPFTSSPDPGRECLRKHSVRIGRFSGLTQPIANRAIKRMNRRLISAVKAYQFRFRP